VERQGNRWSRIAARQLARWACVLCAATVVAGIARAQTNTVEVNHPAGLTRLLVAAPTTVAVGTTGGTTPRPTYVYRPAGRFQLWTGPNVAVGGNPLIPGDEDRPIASDTTTGTWSLLDFTSKVTISVDSEQAIVAGTTYLFDLHDLMQSQTPDADTANLVVWWPQPMTAGARDVTGTAYLPLSAAAPGPGEDMLRIRHGFTLVHDGLMLEYTIYNDTAVTHKVGLRTMIDARFGGASPQDGTHIVLDDGSVILTEAVIPDPSSPGETIPDTWVSYDDPDDPLVSVRGTLEGAEVHNARIATESAGLPDEIAFGRYANIGMTNQFDFVPNAGAALTGEDWAYAVKWQEEDLGPGQSRRYVTYYGLGAAAVDYDPPCALAAYAPAKLQVMSGDDASTPEVETFYLADTAGASPFPVTAMLDNFGAGPLINASVRISLPSGLELSPDTQPRTISLGVVNRNQSPLPQAQWTVRATALRPGRAEIKFTGPMGKVVARTISIPAIPIITPLPSQLGLEMISVPYEFMISDASNVFGSLSDSPNVGGPVTLWRWNQSVSDYSAYPDPWTANISPGNGYWLLNQNRETVVLPATAQTVATSQSYGVSLQAGWDQIGNPFVVPIAFDQLRVIGPQGVEWSLDEAIGRGLLLPVLYAYDAEENEYTWATSMQDAELVPYQGYWLLSYADITLLFPPPTLFALASGVASAAGPQCETEGWRVSLEVAAAGATCRGRSFGVAAAADDGVDLADVPRPPAALRVGPALDAYFTMGASFKGAPYLVDTKADGQGERAWSFTVFSEAVGAPVTIGWPSLSEQLPSDLIATLEDVSAGRSTYMRTSAAYTYEPGAAGARHFRIVVRPRARASLGLMGVTCAQAEGGRMALTYALSAPARVDVEVRNIAGRMVRRVAADRDCPAGQNTLVWDGADERGTRVPAGRYLVRVTARSPETGESISVVSTAHMWR
jgi:hypothetical protein